MNMFGFGITNLGDNRTFWSREVWGPEFNVILSHPDWYAAAYIDGEGQGRYGETDQSGETCLSRLCCFRPCSPEAGRRKARRRSGLRVRRPGRADAEGVD